MVKEMKEMLKIKGSTEPKSLKEDLEELEDLEEDLVPIENEEEKAKWS